MHLVLVDSTTYERVDDRWWVIGDAHTAMECLRDGCHLAVVSSVLLIGNLAALNRGNAMQLRRRHRLAVPISSS